MLLGAQHQSLEISVFVGWDACCQRARRFGEAKEAVNTQLATVPVVLVSVLINAPPPLYFKQLVIYPKYWWCISMDPTSVIFLATVTWQLIRMNMNESWLLRMVDNDGY